MSTRQMYGDQDMTYGPTPALWHGWPLAQMKFDPETYGTAIDDQFAYVGAQAGWGQWDTFIDAGGLITGLGWQATGPKHGLQFLNDAGDNDVITLGSNSQPFVISGTTGTSKKLQFETMVNVSSLTAEHQALFFGLAATGALGATGGIIADDTGAVADLDTIGFWIDATVTNTLDFAYKASGETQAVAIAGVHTLVADAWVKLAFTYDPSQPVTKRITVYVNNVASTTFITEDNIDTATFPEDVALGPVICLKCCHAAASNIEVAFVRAAQYL